jgi:hypothetical protein
MRDFLLASDNFIIDDVTKFVSLAVFDSSPEASARFRFVVLSMISFLLHVASLCQLKISLALSVPIQQLARRCIEHFIFDGVAIPCTRLDDVACNTRT